MNYVQEMTSFYSWLELNPLTPSAINLWHALMHMNHKADCAETLSVTESVLCTKTKVSARMLRKARKELKEKGRIDYVPNQGKAPVYRIIPFQDLNESDEWQKTENHLFEKMSSSINEKNTEAVQSSELNSDVHTDDAANPAKTSENDSDVYSDDQSGSVNTSDIHTEPHSISENTSEVCSTLFRQQQTDKQPRANWSNVIETLKSVFGFTFKAHHDQMLDFYMNMSKMSKTLVLEAIERLKRECKPILNDLWKCFLMRPA